MATTIGRSDPPVEQSLYDEAYRFAFFQAVRLLERLQPDRQPVGEESRREVARFRSHLSLAFPPSEVFEIRRGGEGMPPTMTVAFLGLAGASGVLPHPYTELLLERARAGDSSLASFLDMFNHRLVSHFYAAWVKYRPFLAFERGREDRFTDHLFHLIGLGAGPLRNRHAFPDAGLPFFSGHLAQRRRPAIALESLLCEFFGHPVRVESFVGQWLRLEPADQSSLSKDGPHNQLGVSLVVGSRVWDDQGKFRLKVGPLTFKQFRKFLPDGPAFRPMAQMTRLFVDGELDFDVQVILKAEEVPACQLSSKPGKGSRLGRFAWLKSREFQDDAEDAIFASGV